MPLDSTRTVFPSHSVYRTEKLDSSQAKSLRALQDSVSNDDDDSGERDEADGDLDFWDTPSSGREVNIMVRNGRGEDRLRRFAEKHGIRVRRKVKDLEK